MNSIRFEPVINGQKITQDSTFFTQSGEQITISTLRFYVSKINLENNAGESSINPAEYHLFDLENPETSLIEYDANKSGYLNFNLGIDSLTNVSGILDGDLDPIKGMYWTWNSGYINFKLEGSIKNDTGEKKFEYHIGGYLPPFQTIQKVSLTCDPLMKEQTIYIHIDALLEAIQVQENTSIMIPGKEAVRIAQILSDIISTKK